MSDMKMNSTRLKNTTYDRGETQYGTNFEVSRGEDTEWDFFYPVFNPPYYTDYFVRCPIPTDWELTSVLDPYQIEQIGNIINGRVDVKYIRSMEVLQCI